jgi:small-conductance mechanosensitive channel/CRP-like cAMP-binding protein
MGGITDYLQMSMIFICSIVIVLLINYALGNSRRVSNQKKKIVVSLFSMLVLVCVNYLHLASVIYFQQEEVVNLFTIVVQSLAWLLGAFFIDSLIDFFIWHGILTRKGARLVPKVVSLAFSFVLYSTFIALMLYFVYGKGALAILSTSGALVFIIGYSSKGVFAEIFCGISININQNIRLGDYIAVGDKKGNVKEMNWRAVVIKSWNNTHWIIPNSRICHEVVNNMTTPSNIVGHWFEIDVSAKYSPNQIIKIFKKACHDPLVCVRDFEPYVTCTAISASKNSYFILFHTADPLSYTPRSEILSSIYSQFQREGIELAYQNDVVRFDGEEHVVPYRQVVGDFDLQDFKTAIKENEYLNVLKDEDLEQIAKLVQYDCYSYPERIITQGEEGSSIFLVSAGKLESYILEEGAKNSLFVREYSRGNIFGLKGVLTGSTRRITVRPSSQKACVYEIPKEAIKKLFERSPSLVEVFAGVLAERELKARDALNEFRDAQARGEESEKLSTLFFKQIKILFC